MPLSTAIASCSLFKTVDVASGSQKRPKVYVQHNVKCTLPWQCARMVHCGWQAIDCSLIPHSQLEGAKAAPMFAGTYAINLDTGLVHT